MAANRPKWKPAADALYESDPKRFRRLIVWIRTMERDFSEQQISKALTEFRHYDGVEPWWPYLTVLLRQQVAKQNARSAEAKHDAIKSSEAKFAKFHKWLRELVK